jgi:hypothetical protein
LRAKLHANLPLTAARDAELRFSAETAPTPNGQRRVEIERPGSLMPGAQWAPIETSILTLAFDLTSTRQTEHPWMAIPAPRHIHATGPAIAARL